MNRKAKRPSQLEIAKVAGVSRATVSAVLRGAKGLAPATVERVLAVARRMGYRPNALVAGIKTGKTRSIGLFIHPWDSFWTGVLNGVSDRLAEADHVGILLLDKTRAMGHDAAFALTQVHRALDRWCDAVILWPFFASLYANHIEEFSSRNVPVVTVDHILPARFKADAVETDEMEIASFLVAHLAEAGHRRFLVIGGPEGTGWADERVEAFEAHLAIIPNARFEIVRIPPAGSAVAPVTERLAHPNRPTAIIASTDHYAHEAYVAAAKAGLSVPGDLSVTGVGDLDFAALLHPPLTTVRQDGYAVGRAAAQIALERSADLLRGGAVVRREPTRLVVRESTAAPSVAPKT